MLLKLSRVTRVACLLLCSNAIGSAATLGSFTFNDAQFGNTLVESDGGAFRSINWLNVVNADPGNPAVLTGANFDTGIGNIGLVGGVFYTIGYNSPIVNGPGNDLGLVSARFSSDTFSLAVSKNGISFTASIDFGPALASATGVARNYFYNGTPNRIGELFVTPIDLSAFGLAAGETVSAVRVTAFPEGELIRIAGLSSTSPVPEPGTLLLLSSGLVFAARMRLTRSKV